MIVSTSGLAPAAVEIVIVPAANARAWLSGCGANKLADLRSNIFRPAITH